jgi:hypothetical protein
VAELSTVLQHVADAQAALGDLSIYGVVKLRIGGNSRYRRLAEEQTKEIAARFGAPVFNNKVPEDARFGESHLAREPIGAYSSSARSAIAFRCVAEELVIRRGWELPKGRPERSFILSKRPDHLPPVDEELLDDVTDSGDMNGDTLMNELLNEKETAHV